MMISALHLAAMDCPVSSVSEITRILLLAGGDPRIEDYQRRSAYHLARECLNQEFLDIIQEYIEVRNGSRSPSEYQALHESLNQKYRLIDPALAFRRLDAEFLASLPFIAPDFLGAKERVGQLPHELSIHEHHIVPLAEHANDKKTGVDALKALRFAREQAQINEKRRLKLAQLADVVNDETRAEEERTKKGGAIKPPQVKKR